MFVLHSFPILSLSASQSPLGGAHHPARLDAVVAYLHQPSMIVFRVLNHITHTHIYIYILKKARYMNEQ